MGNPVRSVVVIAAFLFALAACPAASAGILSYSHAEGLLVYDGEPEERNGVSINHFAPSIGDTATMRRGPGCDPPPDGSPPWTVADVFRTRTPSSAGR